MQRLRELDLRRTFSPGTGTLAVSGKPTTRGFFDIAEAVTFQDTSQELLFAPNDWVAPPVGAPLLGLGPDYPVGQCTWWAAKRYAELHAGKPWANVFYISREPDNRIRNAKDWPAFLPGLVQTTPRVGSVVGFTHEPFQRYGHVGIVEAIHGDSITVSQSNWPQPLTQSTQTYKINEAAWFMDEGAATPAVAPSSKPHTVSITEVTTYNPEPRQNDAACLGLGQCTGANGVQMQEGMIALSRDLLTGHPGYGGDIPYGTKVHLSSPGQDPRCTGDFVVEDTMNIRYHHRLDVFVAPHFDARGKSRNFSCHNATLTW